MVRSSPALSNREHSIDGEKLSLLAVFAHPEDESFGPAGTLARYASEGIEVSLAMATRESTNHDSHHTGETRRDRDRMCSCRTTGVRRVCLLDSLPGELAHIDPDLIEGQLVRLIREVRPHVIITLGPAGIVAGTSDHQILSDAVTSAFRDAGDASKFHQHLTEGLGTFAPQKLYHCVLPNSLVSAWDIQGISTVADDLVTTILDVSQYGEAMSKALYCQRHHILDSIRWLTEEKRVQWGSEYYTLIESRLNKKPRREKDLFAGLR